MVTLHAEHARARASRISNTSSRKGLRVFLWVMFGHAEEVLSEVKIVKRVTGGKMNQQTRLHQLEDQGVFVMPHFLDHKYPWELQTKTHMVKHAKPIKELEVSVNEDDEARLTLADDVSTCAPWLAHHFGVVTGRF